LSKVLVAVDIVDDSRRVFAHALALARSHNAKLYVLHAASPDVAFNHGATERVDFLRGLRSLAEAAGVDVRVEVQRGYVAEIILLHARARRPDVIVLGMSGKERRRGLSGWIAEQVLRKAQCPTLVVPKASAVATPTFDTILCAVDFSPASNAAVDEALRLVPPPRREAVSTQVVVGQSADEILRAARAIDASLLVIAAGGRTRVGGRLFGKTGTLLRDAPCPVLAVPMSEAVPVGAERELKTAA
jgi:nucleotide-binding universal stress UspA family protein